jgi:hypothetical protein
MERDERVPLNFLLTLNDRRLYLFLLLLVIVETALREGLLS